LSGFREKLAKRQRMARTLVCVGLDPLAEKMPECVRKRSQTIAGGVYYWMSGIVSATAPYASMFKPQIAHWEAIDGGIKKLKDLIAFIHFSFPDIPVFLTASVETLLALRDSTRLHA